MKCNKLKVKVAPYTSVRREVPVREDTYLEPSACEVRWPVPFHAAFISPMFLRIIRSSDKSSPEFKGNERSFQISLSSEATVTLSRSI